MPSPLNRFLSRKLALVLLAAYVLFVLWVLLRQSPELGTQVSYRLWQAAVWLGAAPTWENFVWAEFVANVGMLVPLILLCTIIWPRPSWRDWTAGVFLFSLGVEFIQAALLAERSASYSDVVANTLGGCAGAVLGLVARRFAPRASVSGSE